MQTYDRGAGTPGMTNYPWRVAWKVFRRWIDRERELIALRNAVGMMAEARRADAAEYDEMRESNRNLRARIAAHEQMADDKIGVQACRPEDRAMLNTPAGRELLSKTAAAMQTKD